MNNTLHWAGCLNIQIWRPCGWLTWWSSRVMIVTRGPSPMVIMLTIFVLFSQITSSFKSVSQFIICFMFYFDFPCSVSKLPGYYFKYLEAILMLRPYTLITVTALRSKGKSTPTSWNLGKNEWLVKFDFGAIVAQLQSTILKRQNFVALK